MAYQSVGTPRFYINDPQFLASNNARSVTQNNTSWSDRILNELNPTNYFVHSSGSEERFITTRLTNGFNYVAWLGHNLSDTQYRVSAKHINPDGDSGSAVAITGGVNISGNGNAVPPKDGFHIHFYNQHHDTEARLYVQSQGETHFSAGCGAISIGRYYDMPHSPDLSLTQEREYAGTNTIETKGGATLSNSLYHKPALWGNGYPPWELYNHPSTDEAVEQLMKDARAMSKSGRRLWNLSFSYLDDGDLFGSNQTLFKSDLAGEWAGTVSDYNDTGDIISGNENENLNGTFGHNIMTDLNFYSSVIHRTNGGQLPFIFQPDNTDFTNMAIAKFDQKSFQYKQVAFGVYDISLKIREVW